MSAEKEVKDVEEAPAKESFGGCDSCSGVSCTPDGLIGLNTYDWKYLCIPTLPCMGGPAKSPPLLKPDAKLPLMLSLIMGLQHALAMLGGIITPPSLISGDACFAWQLDQELCDSKQYMISAALICSGLLSLVQILRWKLVGGYTLGTGLISVIGTSFTFLPIAREVVVSEIQAGRSGMDAYGKFLGTCLAASVTELFISFIPPRYLKKVFPPVVSGTCVCLIGAGLSVAGLKYWGGGVFCAENDMSRAAAFGSPQICTGNGDVALPYGDVHYFGLGMSVMIFLVFIQAVGSPFMKNCSVALALFFGFFVAGVSSYTAEDGSSLPYVNSDKIDQAGVFTFLWTTTFNIGFYPPAFIPLLLGFVITAVETVGDIQASCDVSGLPIEGPDADSRIQGGLLADGVNSFLACLMTCPPNTTFSQNNGVIAITRCASRAAGIACCFWLILLGCFEKFGAAIASIPDAVLGGMTTFLFANVLVSGINIVGGSGNMGRRTRFILAVSLGVGVGVSALPNWAEGGGLAGFHGGNLKHNIGLWPAKDVCEVFPTEEYESEPAKCTVGAYTAASISHLLLQSICVDCTGMGGAYTAPVTATRTVTTCIGNNGNCCVKYNDSKKMWRDSLIIIMKTPYCIGTLLALFLHLLLPFETEDEDTVGENVKESGEANM
ncbi:unnamed protein product [Symbiodinium natans]|uniref:Uric acid-xanthine permease n=1 Tax=Symbiodinium natans TaxID=878477 RepID=A0A812URL5_9DINO|nr:unnamed protein product [Symbiodinium natans]